MDKILNKTKHVILTIISILMFSQSVFAADGYGNLKFGMGIDEIKQNLPFPTDDSGPSPIRILTTEEFPFRIMSTNKKKCLATLTFFNNKFQRLLIDISNFSDYEIQELKYSLCQRYGYPSKYPSRMEVREFLSKMPKSGIEFDYDNNTIILYQQRTENPNDKPITLLVYQSEHCRYERLRAFEKMALQEKN